MNTHLMIVHPRYVAPILAGSKIVEARLGTDRRAPFDRVDEGDTVFIKPTSQRVTARARVTRVDQYEELTPELVEHLRDIYNDRVQGPDEYWDAKIESRYATFITLDKVTPIYDESTVPQELLVPSRNAWRVLEHAAAFRSAA